MSNGVETDTWDALLCARDLVAVLQLDTYQALYKSIDSQDA